MSSTESVDKICKFFLKGRIIYIILYQIKYHFNAALLSNARHSSTTLLNSIIIVYEDIIR